MPPASHDTAIRALRVATNEALARRDPLGVADFFQPDALVMVSSGLLLIGAEQLSAYLRQLFADPHHMGIFRSTDTVYGGATTAAESGSWFVRRRSQRFDGRYLARWDRGADGWKIAGEFFVLVAQEARTGEP
ncbi:YybH family protein [Tianweitania sediminis]|uniref:Nuclear transport factor 2 family protein n=1 Tax=Tianweitania sediminis TaxID=1502156 RepID=A0A8J7UFF5_9HYPH|nr:nuclear transport factor 2 family protein [Tianweitania sediminis]MBP0437059.1 nuclear transport factor 2 family protein [Tianweitania sediminis]